MVQHSGVEKWSTALVGVLAAGRPAPSATG
ncbi:hypothetical protein JOF53_000265 [Crossiella equi]|uniref:Uncharacterized protein n=1 Tax=Crossiella equi TaxID=130796 RepID=A0ABS5A491_9PSEU|nr:hypothetical protein [Crossiella equi]